MRYGRWKKNATVGEMKRFANRLKTVENLWKTYGNRRGRTSSGVSGPVTDSVGGNTVDVVWVLQFFPPTIQQCAERFSVFQRIWGKKLLRKRNWGERNLGNKVHPSSWLRNSCVKKLRVSKSSISYFFLRNSESSGKKSVYLI